MRHGAEVGTRDSRTRPAQGRVSTSSKPPSRRKRTRSTLGGRFELRKDNPFAYVLRQSCWAVIRVPGCGLDLARIIGLQTGQIVGVDPKTMLNDNEVVKLNASRVTAGQERTIVSRIPLQRED